MTTDPRRRRAAPLLRSGACAIGLAVATAGCGGARGGAPAYTATARVEPTATAATVPSSGEAALPALPVAQVEESGGSLRRIQNLEVVDQDLRLVLRGLAESFNLSYQIDPSVAGRVTTRLQDVTLQQALDALVLPHGYAYELQDRVLRVVPSRLQTRIFSLDYISMSRSGVGTTVVQRRLGTGGAFGTAGEFGGIPAQTGGGVFPGGVAGGADLIQSVTVADLWEEIRVSLEGLIFDSAGPEGVTSQGVGTQPAGAAGSPFGGATRAPGAFSRVGDDGRRLIINPLSGTIVVAASPDKLADVALFLSTIEGSVQRQVLIEAKIVEVALDREFQFGIDWGLVQRIGRVALQLSGGAGGAQFTLGDPGQDSDQVSVVLTALEQQGEVSVLSSPRVSVMNNQRAVINVSTDEVFFSVTRQPILGPNGTAVGFNTQILPQQISVGIVLDVLPQVAPDNTITMNVRPVITDVLRVDSVRLEDGTRASAPVIDRRETDTVVRVRGGETVVIGGLMQTRRRESESGIPVLRDIPGLGRLFGGVRSELEKRELVIFITPRIVASQPPGVG